MPSLVQSASQAIASQSGTTCTVTLPSPTTAGNCLVLAFSYFDPNNGGTVSSVKLGSSADNWALKLTSSGGTSQDWPGLIDFYADPLCAGGQTTVTITVSILTPYPYEGINAWVGEFAGLTGAVDVSHTGYNYGGSGLNWSSGTTATTAQAAEVWVGMGVTWQNGASNPITGPSSGGWTNVPVSASGQYAAVAGYQVRSSTGTATYAGTMATSGQSSNAAVICLLAVTSPAPSAVTGKAVIGSPVVSTGTVTASPSAATGKAAIGSPVISVPAQPAEHILVPAYSYPSGGSSAPYWEALYASTPALKYLIADINSGSLTSPANSDYTSAISAAQAVPGITVVGYVDTEHTSTSISTLEANIDLYFSLYGVTSIFFDNASTDTGSLSYYTTLCNYVHTAHAGAVTVLNHGVTPNQGYAAIADVMIVFEGPSYPDGTGIGDWQGALAGTIPDIPQLPASWFSSYSPGRFCAIVYETAPSAGLAGGTPEAWQSVLGQAQAAGIGLVYLTDATLAANPYDVLPTYWTDEVAAVSASAVAAVAPPAVTGKASFPSPGLSAGLTAVAVHGSAPIPGPGVSGSASTSPASAAGLAVLSAPAFTSAAAAAPAAAAGSAVLHLPVVALPGTAFPSVVTGSTVIAGSPAAVAGVAPAAVTGLAVIAAPALSGTAAVTPSAVQGSSVIAAPALLLAAAVTPAAVAGATTISAAPAAGSLASAPAVHGTPVLGTPAVAAGAVALPSGVLVLSLVPAGAPSVTAGSAIAAPATVAGTTTISASPVVNGTASPAVVAGAVTLISGTPAAGAAAAPSAVAGQAVIPAPGITCIAAVLAVPVTGQAILGAAAAGAGTTAAPAAWFAPAFLTAPGISAGLTATGLIAAPAVIGSPGISAGLRAAAASGSTTIPAVIISAGAGAAVIAAGTVTGTVTVRIPALLSPQVPLYPPGVTISRGVPLAVSITRAVPLAVASTRSQP